MKASQSRRTLLTLLTLAFCIAGGLTLTVPEADARRPMPDPAPTPAPQPHIPQGNVACELEVQPPRSVAAAYDEYFTCLEPRIEAWLSSHPQEVAFLEDLYQGWRLGRHSDYRDSPLAAAHVRDYPTNFQQSPVHLTAPQADSLRPNLSANPVEVSGAFQRFFVDGQSERLFLTSEELGLVSIAINRRYAYEFEGAQGSGGSADFFIYDGRTAFVEEEVQRGANRDLVVLDISNRRNPREIHRLKGVLPAVGFHRPQLTLMALPDRAPTFNEYLAIQEGQVHLAGKCSAPPVVSTHSDIRCRRDGSCYKIDTNADLLECQTPVRIGAPGRPLQDTRTIGRLAADEFRGGGRAAPQPRPSSAATSAAPVPPTRAMEQPRERASQPRARAGVMEDSMPTGGAGGAGSLSQMMVAQGTLFVLSATHSQREGWLTSFDLSNPRRPHLKSLVALDNGPEALQLHDNLLLIAGRDALLTASIDGPKSPIMLGEYRQNCPVNFDPVVVQGSIAYRTIIIDQPRSMCSSRLEIIDLSQPHRPLLRDVRNLQRPRGLAILGRALFIADESRGIVVFDLSDPVAPQETTTLPLRGVKDLVINGFDLFAMSSHEIQTFYIGDLFVRGSNFREIARTMEGYTTVLRRDRSS